MTTTGSQHRRQRSPSNSQARQELSMRIGRFLVVVASIAVQAAPIVAQGSGTILDQTIPPGTNFDKANFRLWLPANAGAVQAIAVLVPGSNGDGRPQVNDTAWQRFATSHQLALLGVQFTDKPHDQNFIEEYVNVSRG